MATREIVLIKRRIKIPQKPNKKLFLRARNTLSKIWEYITAYRKQNRMEDIRPIFLCTRYPHNIHPKYHPLAGEVGRIFDCRIIFYPVLPDNNIEPVETYIIVGNKSDALLARRLILYLIMCTELYCSYIKESRIKKSRSLRRRKKSQKNSPKSIHARRASRQYSEKMIASFLGLLKKISSEKATEDRDYLFSNEYRERKNRIDDFILNRYHLQFRKSSSQEKLNNAVGTKLNQILNLW